MPEPTLETLAVWLKEVVATVPDEDTLKAFHAAVVFGARCKSLEMLDVVALAHRSADKGKIEWFAELARSKSAPIPTTGSEALVRRLAAASTVRMLTSSGMTGVAAGLATQSAAFVRLTPDLPEVAVFANDLIVTAGEAVRSRAFSYEPVAPQLPGWVDRALAAPVDGTPPSERPNWEDPAIAVANQLDALAVEIQHRLELLDEEYNLLWWSHAGRSLTADAAWDAVSPLARRVVLIGHELGGRTRIPATAMVDGLAAVALGPLATNQVALVDVVIAARDERIALATTEHTLLPISTALTQANIYTEDDTWKTVVKKVHGIDVSKMQPAALMARQLLREQQLGMLL